MLKLENVTKYYYSSSSVTCALRKINLEFNIGEFIAITGESGSGKTTLLNILSGLDSYEEGEMYFYDKKTSYFDAKDWEQYRKEEISFIFQNYNLIDSYTVLENAMVPFLIDGLSPNEAKEKAKKLLKFVGLEKDLNKKGTKLSGGQKQRLAIARALAKETNVIVADEPTGNLDSENGIAILKLLKEISKDKLVIVVTHNLGQIEPFITRKVRLHDGEVVSDETYEEVNNLPLISKEKEKENNLKKIFNFSFLNIKSQPNKSLILFLLVFISTLSSFVFYSNFKMNLDEHKTKDVGTSLFVNLDETRMLVKTSDSKVINDQILEDAKVKNVVSVEKYDYITDINYYRSDDYKTIFSGGYGPNPNDPSGPQIFIDTSTITLTNHNRFMRSYLSLDESMLKAGRLPTNSYEMVVYSDDSSILNTEEKVFFRNDRKHDKDTYYTFNVKVVGILKEKTSQAYFSEDLCQMMDLSQYENNITLHYYQLINGRKYPRTVNFTDVVIHPNLTGNNLAFNDTISKTLNVDREDIVNNLQVRIGSYTKDFACNFTFEEKIEATNATLGVSKELFDVFYANFKDKTQFAIFITDYAYLSDVSDALSQKGYDSLSCYNVSTGDYNIEKVIMRYANLIISIAALFVINIVIGLLCYTLLKVKKNDYIIFKMIGLSNSLCKKINYVELLFYGVASNILLVITALIVKNVTNIELINNMFKYVRFYDYLIVLSISLITVSYTGRKFSKFLTKNLKITMLKEEQ